MNLTTAANQYANRPKDERFPSLEAMLSHCETERQLSREVSYNLRDLAIVPVSDQDVRIVSPTGIKAQMSHWSFGQLCGLVGAPASYLRDLPAELIARNLNYGLKEADHTAGQTAQILIRKNGGEPLARAFTTQKYGRLYDAEWIAPFKASMLDHDQSWQTPPTWSGEPAGCYRGDRDSFVIMVNGGSIVNNPTQATDRKGDRPMYRGVMFRNSEVGASSWVMDLVLFDYICGNHIIWGAVYDKQFKRRHVGSAVKRDVLREIYHTANRWAQSSSAKDDAILKSLVSNELAHTKEACVDELKKIGFTKEQATAAYERAEQTETASPRSYWGLAAGATRVSQDSGYQDGRYELDQLAAKVLARGARLVAA